MSDTNNQNFTNDDSLGAGGEEWLDKHGKPTYEYLHSLVEDVNPKAIELLKTIADQHDVPYTENTDLNKLVDSIMLAVRTDR